MLFVGYQAAGTLGREILGGAETVRILGSEHAVRARIARVRGFSAHADRDELLAWVTSLQTPPRRVFVNHGEAEVATSFRDFLYRKDICRAARVSLQKIHSQIAGVLLNGEGQEWGVT